ncbi:hypothetical protein J6590_105105, partial [Homalodisca vitripennis]
SGRPRTNNENVALMQQVFVRISGKSTRRASRELQLPQKSMESCEFILAQMETDESFVSKIVFSDETTFHTNGKVPNVLEEALT